MKTNAKNLSNKRDTRMSLTQRENPNAKSVTSSKVCLTTIAVSPAKRQHTTVQANGFKEIKHLVPQYNVSLQDKFSVLQNMKDDNLGDLTGGWLFG